MGLRRVAVVVLLFALISASSAVVATRSDATPALGAGSSPVAPGTTTAVTRSAVLSTSGQSMFGPGAASAPANIRDTFFDRSLPNTSTSGGDISGFDFCSKLTSGAEKCPTDWGAEVTASASGEIGLSAQLTGGSGGSVGAQYPVKATFTYPAAGSFASGDPVTIKTAVALDPTQHPAITSTFPRYSDVELDGVFGFNAAVSGKICLGTCGPGGFSLSIPTERGKILDVPASAMDYFPGLGLTGHCFNLADNVLFGLGSVGADQTNPACVSSTGQFTSNGFIFQPNVEVTTTANADGSLTATGNNLYLAVPISGVAWAKRIFSAVAPAGAAIPGYFPNLGPFGVRGASLGWKLFDTAFDTTLTMGQTFTLAPKINVTLGFPQSLRYQVQDGSGNPVGPAASGTSATFPAGDQIVITTPHALTGSLHMSPSLSMANSTFTSSTTNTAAETAHVTVGILDFSIPHISDIKLGPVYDKDFGLTSHTTTLSNPAAWQLAGFTSPSLSPFDVTPDPRPVPTPVTVHPVEGAAFTGTVAKFADPDASETPGDYTASIDWGDTATSIGTVIGSAGHFQVTGTHTYAEEGNYVVTVTLTDATLPTNQSIATSAAAVSDASLTASPTSNSTAPGGQAILLWPASAPSGTITTFTDADPLGTVGDYTATVDWGDETTTAGTVGAGPGSTFTVSGYHSYAQLGFFTVTVKVTDQGGATSTAVTHILTYAAPKGGNFVVGGPAKLGSNVNFWGAQWSKKNPAVTGAAPAAFKGWATTPAGPTTCGTTATFAASTGNSVRPPSEVPAYMAVLVTNASSVTQTRSSITGPVTGLIVVQTAGGFGPNPGHPGFATVVAGACGVGGSR